MRIPASRSILLVALIVVSLGSGWFFLRGKETQDTRDIRTLANAKAPWAEQAQALMRLSITQKPEALEFIRKKTGSTEDRLAPWATRALGYFSSPESVALLRGQLQSKVPAVREAAIEALGTRPSPEKIRLLDEAKAQAKGDLENARLKMISLRLASEPEAKSSLARGVIRELERKNLDPAARELLLGQIFFQSPRTREVESYFAGLSARVGETDEAAALAVIRALKIYCPANRFHIFKQSLARTSLSAPARARILNELIFHGGSEAREILSSSGTGIAPIFLENLRKRLDDSAAQSPCSPSRSGS